MAHGVSTQNGKQVHEDRVSPFVYHSLFVMLFFVSVGYGHKARLFLFALCPLRYACSTYSSFENERPAEKIVDSAHLTIDPVVLHHFRKVGLADGANGCEIIRPGSPARLRPRFAPRHPEFHNLIGEKASASSAAERLFAYRLFIHLNVPAADGFQDVSGRLEVTRRASDVAGIVVRDQE